MNRNALFADINKLRNNKNVVDDKKVKKAKKNKKPPPPAKTDKITAKLNKSKPATGGSINTRPSNISIKKSGGSGISTGRNLTPSNITQMPAFRLPGMGPPKTSKTSTPTTDKKEETQSQSPKSPQSPDTTEQPQYKRRKSKKKKKKKKKEAATTIDIADDTLNSVDYDKLADQHMQRDRHKTQISVLADRAYPDASSLFDFQNKPPLLLFTYIFAFLASIDMMVNIPTLFGACNEAEGDDSYYYVYILMVYVGAQFIGTLVIGAWLDRRPIIEILAFLNLCIIIGNIMYTFGVHDKKGVTMLIGRGICGLGSCILVIGYAHVTRYSKLASRESRILYFRFVIAVGTIIGPLIGTIVGGGSANWKFLNIDENNSGSFVVACIGMLYLVSLIVFCIISNRKEEQQIENRALWGRSESESEVIDARYSDIHEDINNYIWRPHRFCSKEAFMLWFLYTTAVFTFWSFCGAIIPVGASQGSNELSTTAVYAVFVYVGITYLAAFGLNKVVFKCFKVQLEKRVIVSLILMIFGSIFLTSFDINDKDSDTIYTWQIVVATPFLTCGFCISTITIPALYVTLVGAGVAGLGLRMSWFFSLASFGLLAGPIYGFLVWKKFGSVNFISHTSSLILLVAVLVGFVMIKTSENTLGKKVTSSQDFTSEDKNGSKKGKSNDLKQGLLTDRL